MNQRNKVQQDVQTSVKRVRTWIVQRTIFLVVCAGVAIAAYWYLDNNSTSSQLPTSAVSETVVQSEETTDAQPVNFGSVSASFEPNIGFVKNEEITMLLPHDAQISGDEIENHAARFLSAMISGDKTGIKNEGSWFQRHSAMTEVAKAQSQVADAIEGVARFATPEKPVLTDDSRSPENPGLRIEKIPEIANAIAALRALGEVDIAEQLKQDAIVALESEKREMQQNHFKQGLQIQDENGIQQDEQETKQPSQSQPEIASKAQEESEVVETSGLSPRP